MKKASPMPRLAFALWSAIFVLTGALKLRNPAAFALEIQAHGLTGTRTSEILAFFLPWLECLCGLALIFGKLRGGARLWLFGLLFVFLFVNLRAEWLGLNIDCGCFGQALKTTPARMAVIDALLLISGGLFFLGERKDQVCSKVFEQT